MDNINKVILSSFVTFLVTFVFNAGLSYLTYDKGSVGIGQSISINNTVYSVIEVENYSDSTISGLKVNVPNDVVLKDIVVSTPIGIEFNKKITNKNNINKQLVINEIPPNRLSRILIPTDNSSTTITSVNHKELNLSLFNPDAVKNPITEVIKFAFILSVIYSTMFFLIDYKQNKRFISLNPTFAL